MQTFSQLGFGCGVNSIATVFTQLRRRSGVFGLTAAVISVGLAGCGEPTKLSEREFLEQCVLADYFKVDEKRCEGAEVEVSIAEPEYKGSGPLVASIPRDPLREKNFRIEPRDRIGPYELEDVEIVRFKGVFDGIPRFNKDYVIKDAVILESRRMTPEKIAARRLEKEREKVASTAQAECQTQAAKTAIYGIDCPFLSDVGATWGADGSLVVWRNDCKIKNAMGQWRETSFMCQHVKGVTSLSRMN